MTKRRAVKFHCLSLVAALFVEVLAGVQSRPIKQWRFDGPKFAVKVVETRVAGLPADHFNLRFEVSHLTGSRAQFFSRDSASEVEIEPEQVRFVTDHVAYVYLGNSLAVTLDGGLNWVTHVFPDGEIKGVGITEDGRGLLRIEGRRRGGGKRVSFYRTLSYGEFWYES